VCGFFAGTESLLTCMNVLLFVLFIILLFTGHRRTSACGTCGSGWGCEDGKRGFCILVSLPIWEKEEA